MNSRRASLKTSVFSDEPLKNACFSGLLVRARGSGNRKGTSKNNWFLKVPKRLFISFMTLFCLGRLYAQTEMDFMINGNGTITKYTGRKNVEAVIPAIIDGKPVIGIGKEAFAGNNLISVTIPGTVETIGESAFSGYKLTSIIIPNSVTAIGNSAFAENNLASVVIHGAAVIESSAFSHDNTIKSVTFGKNLLLRVCL